MGKRSIVNACVLLLLLQGAFAQDANVTDDEEFHHQGLKVRFIGKAPKFDVWPGGQNESTSMRVEIDSIFEKDASDQTIQLHSIQSLAALKPEFTSGTELINSTNVTSVTMRLPFTNITAGSFKYNSSACQPSASEEDFNNGVIVIKVYLGFAEDVTFPYGLNNTVLAPANSTKFSIDVMHWPFCNDTNSLQINLKLTAAMGNSSKPKFSKVTDNGNSEDPVASQPTSISSNASTGSATPAGRKLRGSATTGNSNNNGKANNGGDKPPAIHGGRQHPAHRRDPRVAAIPKDKISLLTSPGKAAMLEFENYAYDAVDGSKLYNVTTNIQENGDHTVISLTFPAAKSLYYDPTVQVDVDEAEAGYTTADTTSLPAADVSTATKSAASSIKISTVMLLAGILALAVL